MISVIMLIIAIVGMLFSHQISKFIDAHTSRKYWGNIISVNVLCLLIIVYVFKKWGLF